MSVPAGPDCQFPLFRARFFAAAAWAPNTPSGPLLDSTPALSGAGLSGRIGSPGSTPLQTTISNGKVISSLDLSALPRVGGDPSEKESRREKIAYFDKHCSEVSEGLFLGSDSVARSRETLREAGVTHVVNCVGMLFPSYFKDELAYQTLYLLDNPNEDIISVLHDVFNFIEGARKAGGKVLVHCSQGVSRSTSLVIAYLMWKRQQNYEPVFSAVKSIRGVANPNIGFHCQLSNWQKRRSGAVEGCRVYRMAPHHEQAPLWLLPKGVGPCPGPLLDPRGAFLVHTPDHLYLWQGARCPAAVAKAAAKAAEGFMRYENAEGPVLSAVEGSEPLDLAAALRSSTGDASAPLVGECAAYTHDYELWERAARAAGEPGSAPNSGRQSKTPRDASEDGDGGESPNHRSRKMRRGDGQPDLEGDDGSASPPKAPASPSRSRAADGVLGLALQRKGRI